jgi:hypothetical protein
MSNQKEMTIQTFVTPIFTRTATSSVLALFIILGSLANSAQASVGRVLFKYGNVSVDSANARLLIRGARIDEGDVIVTGSKGYVQLLLDDGTKIAVRPNSSFEIEALEMPATATSPAIGAGKTLKASFKLQRGGFRTLTGRIARQNPSAYRVTTPAAVIGVRGTNYSTRMCTADCGSGDDGLYVGVSEGEVTMTNAGGELNIPKNSFGFAANFNTPPKRLIAPPSSLQEEGSIALEEESDDEEGDSEDGDSEDGDSEEGDSEEGDSEEGDSEEGDSEAGDSEAGDAEEGSSGDSSSDEENSSDGGSSNDSSGSESSNGESSNGESSEEVAAEFGGGAPPPPAAPSAGTGTTTTTTAPEEPQREIMAEGTGGQVVDITDGQEVVIRETGLAYSAGGVASGINTDFDSLGFDGDDNVSAFSDVNSDGATVTFAIGTASNTNTGFDPTGSLKWGRWSAGVATSTTAAGSTDVDLASSSLHWVLAPVSSNPDRVITGSAEYSLVGNTDPTDDLGNRGVLGSASLFADFTNSVVDSNIQLGIADEVWTASGQGSITSNLFNGLYSTVTVNGNSGASGSFGGVFSDSTTGVPGAAGLSYQLNDSSRTVSGVAIFNARSR